MIDVCEAGGYQAYVSWTAPRQDLLAFRVLVERGRARARGALLGRAFGLSKELFCVVMSFWRNEAGCARRLRRLPVVSRAACAPLDQS